nr:hypothetical protein BaRGS_021494 [Batillaria attramentaria]
MSKVKSPAESMATCMTALPPNWRLSQSVIGGLWFMQTSARGMLSLIRTWSVTDICIRTATLNRHDLKR